MGKQSSNTIKKKKLLINMLNLPEIKGKYIKNFSLSKLTWFQTGGKADVLFVPKDSQDLEIFLRKINKKVPIHIVGGCSNLLIRDGGVKGVVIKLGSGFDFIKIEKKFIICGAGTKNINLSKNLSKQNITGYESLIGVPGTLGGAIFMNSGCYGSEIKDIILSVFVVNRDGKMIELKKKDINFAYRSSGINEDFFIVAAKLKLSYGNLKNINERIKKFISKRKETQPIKNLTGGSTFKNTKKKKAWKIIKDSGCDNVEVGGAKLSSKHCNFLINTGNATSLDLENLGNKIKDKVYRKFSIKLDWEIKIIGKK